MLNEIVSKILETESRAENIEREAFKKAEQIKTEANIEAEKLRLAPSKEHCDKAERILLDAEAQAERIVNDIPALKEKDIIKADNIKKAVQDIMVQFLKGEQ